MDSTSWLRSSLAALLLAAGGAAAASAQKYEHPRGRWRIDFPAGWTLDADAPGGAVSSPPGGGARLRVLKAPAGGARTPAEWARR
ncbi:MAG: hypothetical protein KGM24_15285, partial [Elusimicrobia bacterium]|nr:hypothetical protein [Elusimicrobiota bacterium]